MCPFFLPVGYELKDGDELGLGPVAFSPDGKALAAAVHDGSVKLWLRAEEPPGPFHGPGPGGWLNGH